MSPFADPLFHVCYASYMAAFMLELFRLLATHHRHVVYVQNVRVLSAMAGFLCHTLFLYQQHAAAVQPLDGPTMFFFASAWGLALIYIIWAFCYPSTPFGIVLLPFIILLGAVGCGSFAVMESALSSPRSLAKMFHAAPAAGTVIALAVASTCCLFYFVESHLLRKRWSLPSTIKLPSLEWSLSVFRITCTIALCCLCLCVIGGMLLNFHRENVLSVWRDPIRAGTLCFLLLFVLGAIRWLFHTPHNTENRFVFMLVVILFVVFLSILVGVLTLHYDAHWNKPKAGAAAGVNKLLLPLPRPVRERAIERAGRLPPVVLRQHSDVLQRQFRQDNREIPGFRGFLSSNTKG